MIEKIVKIHNVTKFREYDCHGDVGLASTTLLFAENARGKSTLAAILRSLADNDPKGITARKTTDAEGDPEILIRVGGSNANFSNGAWDTQVPELIVFDSHFVNSNVFSGDYITADHRLAMYHLVIGQPGVELASKITELDQFIRSTKSELNAQRQLLSAHITSSLTPEEFAALQQLKDLDAQITEKESEIESAKQLQAIRSHDRMSLLSLPEFPIQELEELLLSDLAEISKKSQQAVEDHLSRLPDGAVVWIHTGRSFLADGNLKQCPFCGQDLQGVQLLDHFADYFNEQYEDLKLKVDNHIAAIQTLLNEDMLDQLAHQLATNRTSNEFWKQHISYDFADAPTDQLQKTIRTLKAEATTALQNKKASLLEQLPLPNSLDSSFNDYEHLSEHIEHLNERLAEINAKIDVLKDAAEASDIDQLQEELNRLKDIETRFDNEVAQECVEFQTLTHKLETLTAEKSDVREELDNYSQVTLSALEDRINHFLEMSTDIRIVNVDTSHAGGRPRTQFQLSINGVAVPIGSDRVVDEASFTTTLSDGDKNSLAFAFFLAWLDAQDDLNDKIVVIDDPITSLDANRRTITYQTIVELADRCAQLLVMSHDPHFLHDISTRVQAPKHLQIVRGDNESEIVKWNIKETVRNVLENDYELLKAYSENHEADPQHVASRIRPYLEGIARIKYPDQLEPKEWLGDFLRKIRESEPGGPLHHLQGDTYDELNSICDYAKQFHHDQNDNARNIQVVEAELTKFAERTLRVKDKL
jgi:wobble nucleotide-excising tRNase